MNGINKTYPIITRGRLPTYRAPFGVHPAELLPANGGTMTGCKMEFEKGA